MDEVVGPVDDIEEEEASREEQPTQAVQRPSHVHVGLGNRRLGGGFLNGSGSSFLALKEERKEEGRKEGRGVGIVGKSEVFISTDVLIISYANNEIIFQIYIVLMCIANE